ncbi:penicillin-binding protein 2 [Microbacterium esteraromaticum]|uniref:Penicillin-binding protein 2 n=1 Tax=Microbacterium esteraromaticum TaxID=57043 RepID=A0A7D8ALJ3_9MICO|nr:penicillin-binding protein 2 [Microbacterium esteraromaticum]QMU98469.1 penicillin-binding protein 2 [Microbacterium esteraromaticum]
MTTRATRSQRRRTVAALAVILAVLGAFVFRLVDIQMVHADDHVAEGVNTGNLGSTQVIAGARGDITDSDGTVLASSVLVYDAQLSPLLIREFEEEPNPKKKPKLSWDEASERIARIAGLDVDELRESVSKKLAQDPNSQYLVLANGLSTEQYLQLRELKTEDGLAYIAMKPRSVRVYPNGAVAGTALGFLDGSGKAQYGIERIEDSCLAAKNGEMTYLRGQGGVKIPGSEQITPATDGGTVQLTINSDLNWYLQQMIAEEAQKQGAQAGSVTVVEVKTGKIRAMAEYPAVDPNDIDSVDPKYWKSQVFSDAYEPGSTFKPITAAAVLDQGAATPLTTVTAPSREHFPNGAEVNDPFSHPVYQYTFAGALIDSSNVSLSKFGTMIAPETRYDYLQKFGVGARTAVGFPAEQSGQITDLEKWRGQTLYTTTFGQAFTVTPAQIAGAYQALGNGGKRLDLSLVESCTMPDGTVVEADRPEATQVVSEDTAAQVRRMLENVAVQGGLAKTVAVPGYRIGMKTGTAQKPNLDKPGYKKGVYFTNMAGIAPIEDPQYVVLVTLDEPTKIRNSAATAVAFQKAMTQVLKTYRVAPSSQPMDELLPKFD